MLKFKKNNSGAKRLIDIENYIESDTSFLDNLIVFQDHTESGKLEVKQSLDRL